MNALVTGANGFLGASLVAALLERKEFRVRCLVRAGSSKGRLEGLTGDRCEIMTGSVGSYQDCLKALKGIDIVFHLAAAKSGAPAEMFQGSSVATKTLLEAIKDSQSGIRLVHCSSFSVYGAGSLRPGALIDEHTPLEEHPEKRDTYSFSKWHQERLVREYHAAHQIPTVILRPGVIYGPGGTPISTRVGLDLFGLFLFVGGSNLLPLTYVDNCAQAFVEVALKAPFAGEIYNVVDDGVITARRFLSLYRKNVKPVPSVRIPYRLMWLLSLACEKYFQRSKGQLPEVFTRYKTASQWKSQKYDNSRLKELGWTMRTTTEAGLEKHFSYLKSGQ